MASVYSDLQHGIKLSSLLIEVGTPLVRQIFDKEVARHGQLSELLRNKKKELTKFLKGKPRLLTKEQYDLMYPQKGSANSEKFDLTLLFRLLDILCAIPPPPSTKEWRSYPKDIDNTKSANLVRLRYKRNKIYGHIASMKLSSEEFDTNWEKLSDILLDLGAEKSRIQDFKENSIDSEAQLAYEAKMKDLILQDLVDFQSIFAEISELKAKQSQSTQQILDQIAMETQSIQSCVVNEIGISTCKLVDLLSKIEREVLYKAFCHDGQNIWKAITDINTTLQSVSKRLDDEKLKAEQDQCHDTSAVKVTEISKVFHCLKDSFKILISNVSSDAPLAEPHKELGEAMGHIPWDVIIDLDFFSRQTGIYDSVVERLAQYKNIKSITYKETEGITDQERDLVASGENVLYILGNGCPESECPVVKRIAKSTMPIGNLLMNILKRIQPKPLLLVINHLCNSQNSFLTEMANTVSRAMYAEEDFVATGISQCLCLNFMEETCTETFDKIDFERKIQVSLHARELINALSELYPTFIQEEKLIIPSTTGETFITKSELVPFNPYLDLFHKDVGFVDLSNQKNIDSFTTDIKLQYHKGGPLTNECLSLNEKFHVYVKRKEIRHFQQYIEDRLSLSKWSELIRDFIIVLHDASGGGSTVARAALYELRLRFPCVIVKSFADALYDGLLKIWKVARKPLVILFDELEASTSERTTFMRRLENTGIKAQVLYTERITLKQQRDFSGGIKCSVHIPGKLAPEDAASFKQMYQQYAPNVRVQGRVFLYGLHAFLEESTKLDAQISFISANTNSQQKLLLRMCSMMWKYGNYAIGMTIAMRILEAQPEDMVESNLCTTLGYASDLLVSNGNGLKPAHVCIIEPLMNAECGSSSKRVHLMKFTDDLKKVIKICDNQEAIHVMFFHIFSKRKRRLLPHWTLLVVEMDQYLYQKDTVRILRELVECLKEGSRQAHMRALLARYLMYKIRDTKDSIAEIQKACKVAPCGSILQSKEQDSSLLSTYGNLYRQKVKRTEPSHPGKGVVEEYMELVRKDTEEAVNAFLMAQKSTHSGDRTPKCRKQQSYSAVPFIGEAKARTTMLQMYLKYLCDNEVVKFSKFLSNCNDDFIKNSAILAIEALDKMEFLQVIDKLNDDSPDETRSVVHATKLDLLYIQTERTKINITAEIRKTPTNSPLDIGFLIRYDRKKQIVRFWQDLDLNELKFIVAQLQKRLPLNTLRCNFESIVMALLHLRQKIVEESTQYNFEFALECIKQWQDKFSNDHDAHFLYGIFRFVEAYQDEETRSVSFTEALSYFKKCKDICKSLKSTKEYKQIRFYIGKSNGLGRIVPRFAIGENEVPDKLEVFEGRQLSKDKVTVRPFPDHFKAHFSNPDSFKHYAGQQRKMKFNLAIAHDQIYAHNVTFCDSR